MPDNNEQRPANGWCQAHERDIKRIAHTLEGNGQKGLVQRVTIIETRMDTAINLIRWQIGLTVATGGAVIIPALNYILNR